MYTELQSRAPRNRTLELSDTDLVVFGSRLIKLNGPATLNQIVNRTICQDIFEILKWLPANSVDLIFADPPYNLNKSFNKRNFSSISLYDYEKWLITWIPELKRVLKSTSSIYICGDWRSSAAIHRVVEDYFIVQNRITWEREKGRGANKNWKNISEDIWFCTVSENYYFDVESVKLNRRVLAPYTHSNGKPKDWDETEKGRYRITHPSNTWTDITVPFWSMPENTNHPTQKPEKLLAKIILASSREGDVVFDPFLGSGTTSVVAKKLNRRYIGVEIDEMYCCLTEKRLDIANTDKRIQGYSDGCFWERNTLADQKHKAQTLSIKTLNESVIRFAQQSINKIEYT